MTKEPRARRKLISAFAIAARSEVALARFVSLYAVANVSRLVQSRLPLLNPATRQPRVSRAKRKSTRIVDSINADDSEPNGRSSDERSLMRTSSDGNVTPNNSATRQRARFTVIADVKASCPNSGGVSQLPAGSFAP